jgi:hypothetical protein
VILELLANTVKDHLDDPAFVKDIVDTLEEAEARKFFSDSAPSHGGIRKGHFGEILAFEVKQEGEGYVVPIKKLRFVIGNGTLHGTDVLAIKLDAQGDIIELHFVECKLRTNKDLDIAIDAARQLADDLKEKYPAIIRFVIARLKVDGSPLYEKVLAYLAFIQSGGARRTAGISLCVESSSWDERSLDRLLDGKLADLPALHVNIIKLPDLTVLVKKVFDRVPSITEISDDDD